MNLLQLQQEIGRLLSDPNNQRWTTDILTTRINLAQTEVNGYTRAIKTAESAALVSGTSGYALSANVLNIVRVQIANSSGEYRKLAGKTRDQLDFEFPNWRQLSAGEPFAYYWIGTGNEIDVIPAPDYSYPTNGLVVTIVKTPADLSAAGDIPFDSYAGMIPYHMAIVHWVVAQCWMDDGTPEALSKSRFHKTGLLENPGEYEKQLKRIIKDFDAPLDIPARILWKPQGGRPGACSSLTKSNPLNI